MKKFISAFLLIVLLMITGSAFAGEVYVKNAWYGKPGNNMEYVKLETTANPNYNRYVNGRFAYSIYVPREFTIATSPANVASCGFSDEYGSEFNVGGSHNYGVTLTELFNQSVSYHPNAVTVLKGEEWFVISYLDNGYIVYEKHFVNAQYRNSWYFRYPQWLGEKYNPKIADIEASFIPGWKSGEKIRG